MSTSKQVQHSVSQDKLDVIAVKIDEAKETIIGRVRRLMTMEICSSPTTRDESLKTRIGERIEFLDEKLNELDAYADKVTENVHIMLETLDELQVLHSECVNLEKYLAIPPTGSLKKPGEVKPLLGEVKPLLERLLSQHQSTFGCPSFIFRMGALQYVIDEFLETFDSLPQTEERLLLKQDFEVAGELMNRHRESLTVEQKEQDEKLALLVFKERLRLFCKKVESLRNDQTEVFGQFPVLQNVLDNYRRVDRDQRAVNFFVMARKKVHEKENNLFQLHLYIALEELGTSEEVAAEAVRYFLAHDKSEMEQAEQEFYSQIQDWVASSLFHDLSAYLNSAQRTTRREAGVTKDDVLRMSWKKAIPSTVELKWEWLPHHENVLYNARTNMHFKNTFESGLASKFVVFYEFLGIVRLHNPLFDQDFTYLEDYSKVCGEDEFSVVENKFFHCLFPSLDLP